MSKEPIDLTPLAFAIIFATGFIVLGAMAIASLIYG